MRNAWSLASCGAPTGDDDAEPDISHELLHIAVQAEPGTDVPGIAILLKDECAGDLGIEEPVAAALCGPPLARLP